LGSVDALKVRLVGGVAGRNECAQPRYAETVLPSSGAFPAIVFGVSVEGTIVGEDGSG
jgi:hypothetical protein